MKTSDLICQFKVTLRDILPPIWRRIQVPMKYSFWDLHVALQGSMGWLDYHLHLFSFQKPRQKSAVLIGIPDEDGEMSMLPGWEVKVADYFAEPGITALYEYDFGDSWEHELLLEAILLKEQDVKYPRCLAGERACPPEDCGGVPGYERLLEILANPQHEEYQETMVWLKGHAKSYYPYRPDEFEPASVDFDDPKRRLKNLLSRR